MPTALRRATALALLRHLADSFDFLPPLDAAAAGSPSFSVIDVGSGAGFPGAALAAARPAWRVTLVDSLRKRVDFTARAAAGAGIPNCRAVWGRAEDVGAVAPTAGTVPLRESGDAVVARAVDPPFNTFFSGLALHHENYRPFMVGTLQFDRVAYYLMVTYFFLLSATKVLEARRWR